MSDESSEDEFGPLLNIMRPDVENDDMEPQDDTEGKPLVKVENVKDEQPMKRKRGMREEYLDELPCSDLYEYSYMHRDVVDQVCVTRKTNFLVTGSQDGNIRFWKKIHELIEFVNSFSVHKGKILDLKSSPDGLWVASLGEDKTIKVFDVQNFDLVNAIQLDFEPKNLEFVCINRKNEIVVTENGSGKLRFFDLTKENALRTIELHKSAILCIGYMSKYQSGISVDENGFIEIWNVETMKKPSILRFKFKSKTDLYELPKLKTTALSIACSPDGSTFTLWCKDSRIRVFDFFTCKLQLTLNETIEEAKHHQTLEEYRIDSDEFARRFAIEQKIIEDPDFPIPQVVYDQSGHILIYPSLWGIKFVDCETGELLRLVGKAESERLCKIALYQGFVKESQQRIAMLKQKKSGFEFPRRSQQKKESVADTKNDPISFCTSFKRDRFFMFTKYPPEEAFEVGHVIQYRDVINEAPRSKRPAKKELPKSAIIHTTFGDIHIKFYPEYAPMAVENFILLGQSEYYNGVIFHRVIKNFMIQSGDPYGDGTGGTSFWGEPFGDEFHPKLRHKAFMVSMANSGPNTNGSQFFITCVDSHHLDDKHTIFAEVTKGNIVVKTISSAPTKLSTARPHDDIRITSISFK